MGQLRKRSLPAYPLLYQKLRSDFIKKLPHLKVEMREFLFCNEYVYFAKRAFTFSEIRRPSVFPANCLLATPITLPIS